jgi:hypothetical protein
VDSRDDLIAMGQEDAENVEMGLKFQASNCTLASVQALYRWRSRRR